MSHHSRIVTRLTDLAELKATLEDLGCEVREGTLETELSNGQRYRPPTSLEITALPPTPGETEKRPTACRPSTDQLSVLGFMKVSETFDLVADLRAFPYAEQERLKDIVSKHYAYRALRTKLEAQGFTVTKEEAEGGEVKLVLSRGEGQVVEGIVGSAGKVSVKARGFKGDECLAATQPLEVALGTVEERELTAEGFFGATGPATAREPEFAVVTRTPEKKHTAPRRESSSEREE